MDASRLTSSSVEVINAAGTLAINQHNPQIDPVHLLAALLNQEKSTVEKVLTKAGFDVAAIRAE
ncbi:MAG TPA: Clp protease N-terminal domain-containing protein, partial [Marmoricola sp.]|nr:Clp protease N-terminal domain-containing protein [Marmoricola sp.]